MAFIRCWPTRDETGEALGGELRPGNAGANTAADQIAVAEHALAQIPAEHVEGDRAAVARRYRRRHA